MKKKPVTAFIVLLFVMETAPAELRAAAFEILFPYGGSVGEESVHVSDDGTIVLGGRSHPSYLWEESKGITFQTYGYDYIFRNGMSGDGKTILACAHPCNFHPTDASYDGSVVAGFQSRGNDFLTVEAVGIVNGQTINLGKLSTDDTGSRAWAVSADGSTIVGSSHAHFFVGVSGGIFRRSPFRWTRETGMTSLSTLPGASLTEVSDVSGDGSVIVGRTQFVDRSEVVAFRWTEATGMQSLGDLPGGRVSSEAFAVSANGRVVVGRGYADPALPGGYYDPSREAVIWTEDGGMRDLREVLINEYNMDFQNYRLRSATGVSANGNVIVGWGEGAGTAFVWRVNLVPEPSTFIQLVGINALLLFTRKRRLTHRSPCSHPEHSR